MRRWAAPTGEDRVHRYRNRLDPQPRRTDSARDPSAAVWCAIRRSLHGTQVLGIVCGNDPAHSFVGVAPNPQSVNVVSYKFDAASLPSMSTLAEAIAFASSVLASGDVLLIEAQTGDAFPVETDPTCYENIRLATADGVVVVEPAGNGGSDLDSFVDGTGSAILTRAVRDSLAIMVAAASSATPHTWRVNSNYGTRIDCFAWGDNVFTSTSSGPGDTSSFAPPCFPDTSAASAIIAGAALSTQGMMQDTNGTRLDPAQLRTILADPNNGTAATGPHAAVIGVMPDLQRIANLFAVSPTGPPPAAPTNLRIIS